QDGQVVVFRGVPGSIAGLSLHRPQQHTDLEVGAFSERTRERLAQNIDAGDRSDAEQVVANLRAELSGAPVPDQGVASEPTPTEPTPTQPTPTEPTAGPAPAPTPS
ncbi:MAG: hypothetical protein JWL64_1785, partial [Frankiales bacterium]|nr:hypothetical protein [Frankiales bacterium]